MNPSDVYNVYLWYTRLKSPSCKVETYVWWYLSFLILLLLVSSPFLHCHSISLLPPFVLFSSFILDSLLCFGFSGSQLIVLLSPWLFCRSLAPLLPSDCQCDVLQGGILALFPFYFFPLYSFPQKTYSYTFIYYTYMDYSAVMSWNYASFHVSCLIFPPGHLTNSIFWLPPFVLLFSSFVLDSLLCFGFSGSQPVVPLSPWLFCLTHWLLCFLSHC